VALVGADHPGTLLAGWDHHLDAHQVIAGQTHAAGEPADPAAQGDAADAGVPSPPLGMVYPLFPSAFTTAPWVAPVCTVATLALSSRWIRFISLTSMTTPPSREDQPSRACRPLR
jgi:hypothetical protein